MYLSVQTSQELVFTGRAPSFLSFAAVAAAFLAQQVKLGIRAKNLTLVSFLSLSPPGTPHCKPPLKAAFLLSSVRFEPKVCVLNRTSIY